jgi:two-component system, cell cycle sensor histidine kinase and response regulator CckA
MSDRVTRPPLVRVPTSLEPLFADARRLVEAYFTKREEDPSSARITFSGERFILVRAASMSTEFFDLVSALYRERGDRAAREVAQAFLFDLAHALGKADAAAFHREMGLVEPLERLSAGPPCFAYTGWGTVHLLEESVYATDESFVLVYDHFDSFEADAWLRSGRQPDFPVCVMNAGYSSGWCEQSYSMPLVAAELECRARGDSRCRFVMAPPSKVREHLSRGGGAAQVPEFFSRKRLEDDLERRVLQRTAELEQLNAELREANTRLKELHRAREEFVAAVSHELRTPLVTGLGYVDLVLKGQLGAVEPEVESGLRVAERNLKRLSALIGNMLAHSTLTRIRDAVTPHRAPVDVGALCRGCLQDFLVRSGRDAAAVSLCVTEGSHWSVIDEEMIRTVLVNLLDNAHRYAGEGARITISVERAGDLLQVSVIDDGGGMSPEVRARAVDAYFTTGADRGGIGIGLSIVKRLLEAHGLVLTLDSHEGGGTRASFRLAVTPAPGPAEQQAPAPPPPPQELARGERILVVDDDRDTVGFLELALGRRGYRVVIAYSAERALELLERGEVVDALLVDISLPGWSGIELCRRTRSAERTAAVPVLMFTARAEPRCRREADAAGCDAYLVKPLGVDELDAELRKVLARRPAPV